ncbi:hypothetical protein R6Q57_026767 [Mikania cordata]
MAFHNSGHIHLLFITIILLTSVTSGDDAAVMTKLSTTLSPTPTSWTGTAYCKWDGIACDNSNHVTAINLPSKSLTRTLPPDINQLSEPKTLAVQRNFIFGALSILANLTLLASPTTKICGLTNSFSGFLGPLPVFRSGVHVELGTNTIAFAYLSLARVTLRCMSDQKNEMGNLQLDFTWPQS